MYLSPPLIHYYLLHTAIMYGVTNLITRHSMTQLMVQAQQETSIIPFHKTQLLEEINNSSTLRLKVTLLEVLMPHYNIQVLSIHQAINTLLHQALAISLKLRVKAYMLSIQVATPKINLQEEIRIQENYHHYIMNQTQIWPCIPITVLEITPVVAIVQAVIHYNTPRATLTRVHLEVLEEPSSQWEALTHLQN